MKSPKGFGRRYFSLAAILAFSVSAVMASKVQSVSDHGDVATHKKISKENKVVNEDDPLVITKKIEVKEVDAPFASEIYTAKDIKNSHSKNLYDFLNTQTSLTVIPSYGNTFSQLIDLRGYGIGNGYENVVITKNGRRLNNIDMSAQLLSSIPLNSIEKIEIIKGSGSVEYGDGANAGVINIITKDFNGATIKTYAGSHGLWFGSMDFGVKKDKFSISGYIGKSQYDGDRYIDTKGDKNKNYNTNKSIKLTYKLTNNLHLFLGKTFSKMDIYYPGSITLAQYEKDPKTISSRYTHQYYWDNVLSYGFDYRLRDNLLFHFDANSENKLSQYVGYAPSRYDYDSYNTRFNYKFKNLKIATGIQIFNGKRKNSNEEFIKDNIGYYLKTDYKIDNNIISFGARRERVRYSYSAKDWSMVKYENAFDAGYNYKLTNYSSLFANINKSFQTPDIDRFFTFNNTTYKQYFNKYIKPMKANNYNIGFNYFKYPQKLKISFFYTGIKDEIYYNALPYPQDSYNTNLDKTRKYGFEIEEKYNIHYNLFAMLNYSYIDTKIIKNSSNPAIEGKAIPGVSKHNVKISMGYSPNYKTTLLLSHVYRSKSYAMSDFDESYGKMQSYNSTDFSVNYKYKKLNLFAKINNIFDKKNALFVDSGYSLGVYPVNYERNFLFGLSVKF